MYEILKEQKRSLILTKKNIHSEILIDVKTVFVHCLLDLGGY